MPTISVVMSVYNSATYLPAAIESILGQTYADFEFIIVNDGSTDESATILQRYAQRDPRIVLINNETNKGLTPSLNIGLRKAWGTFIARQDADDISAPTRFEQQVAYFKAHPEAVLVASNLRIINGEGDVIGTQERALPPALLAYHMLFGNYMGAHSSVMFRQAAADATGGYDETLPYAQDYDLWVRLMAAGSIGIIDDYLLDWRSHGENISHQHFQEQVHISYTIAQKAIARFTGVRCSLAAIKDLRRMQRGHSLKRMTPRRLWQTDRLLRRIVQGQPFGAGKQIVNSILATYRQHLSDLSMWKTPLKGSLLTLMIAIWHMKKST